MEISVVIPCFNSEKTIERCIRSLNNQTIPKEIYELIIVDDGSDNPIEKYISQEFSNVRILKHEKNLGLPSALNTAIKNAVGRYVVRVDSDDYVHNDFLKILKLKFSLSSNVNAVCCDYIVVNEKESHEYEVSFLDHPIGCGIMFKKDLMISLGLYNEKLLMAEEIDFLKRYLQHYDLINIQLPLYRYTRHENNMTNNEVMYNEYKKIIESKHHDI
jgi:glycosyltransferase involved in cell wall biosynthesis